jgi:DNA topoisomerase-1
MGYTLFMASILIDPQLQEQLHEEGLRYSSDSQPGFFRQKRGKLFDYYDLDGKKITDEQVIERIQSLAIPPAWKNVWVCSKKNGHLQATGFDDKNRKQYIYHPDWIAITQENKFAKMVDFGKALPKIRAKVRSDMTLPDLEKRKILATIIWLLEHTFIRVGNEDYAKENNSFGLTTLRNRHVDVKGENITFQFTGKSGVDHLLTISNPHVSKTIKKCIELPGYQLFQYVDENGDRHEIDSADVNAFLKDVSSDDFSAKDFRTWGGTNMSADYLRKVGQVETDKEIKRVVKDMVRDVSSHLGNTVSVCRAYYIHPKIISSYQDSLLIPHYEKHSKEKNNPSGLSWNEHALISLLAK